MSGFVFEYENPYALEALEAVDRIKDFVLRTPVESSPWLQGLCEELGSQGSREGVAHSVHLKLESEQRTGSFKVRGAVNKVLSLSEEEVRQGLITSSTGNHALAFMYACKERQLLHAGHDAGMPKQHVMRPKIYLPVNASKYKLSKLRSLGAADLVLHGEDCVASEMEAARVARETGAVYVSPYNDMKVIGGQGTIALELLQQLPRKMMDYVFVPVGGGGLIAGVASVLKAADRTIRVIGCQPAASDVMRRSVASGAIVQLKTGDTLSDATAGGIEEGSLTLQPCMDYVDEWEVVSEEEIGAAMKGVIQHHSKLMEGAAGCAIAALVKRRSQLAGKSAVVVCCGGNVALHTLQQLLHPGENGT